MKGYQQQDDSGPSAVLQKNPIQDIYYVGQSDHVVNHKPLTKKNLQAYENSDCKALFDNFCPSTDFVDLSRRLDPFHLLHKRIMADEQSTVPPPGFYRFEKHQGQGIIRPHSLPNREDYIPLHNNVQKIQEDMERFFGQSSLYQRLGMQFSRGCLLWGSPGQGKTVSMLNAMHECIDKFNARAFYIPNNNVALRLLEPFRELLDEIPTILLFEEITDHSRRNGESMLSFLDGEKTWENNYTLASTNYPQRLPRNLIDRPGRFDQVIEVPPPDEEDRQRYLEEFLPEGNIPTEVIEETEGFSVAHLKELILRSQLHDQSLEETIQDFKQIKRKIDHAFDEPDHQPGFLGVTNGQP